MRKFVIYTFKGDTSIMEVEVEVLSNHLFFLKEGEWMGKITAPKSLYEKQADGSLKPAVWCWWAFHDTVEECMTKMEQDAHATIARARNKMARHSEAPVATLTPEEEAAEVAESLSKIRVVML
jgi:hypothetical protein